MKNYYRVFRAYINRNSGYIMTVKTIAETKAADDAELLRDELNKNEIEWEKRTPDDVKAHWTIKYFYKLKQGGERVQESALIDAIRGGMQI